MAVGFWVEPLILVLPGTPDHVGLFPEKQVHLKSLLGKDTKETKP